MKPSILIILNLLISFPLLASVLRITHRKYLSLVISEILFLACIVLIVIVIYRKRLLGIPKLKEAFVRTFTIVTISVILEGAFIYIYFAYTKFDFTKAICSYSHGPALNGKIDNFVTTFLPFFSFIILCLLINLIVSSKRTGIRNYSPSERIGVISIFFRITIVFVIISIHLFAFPGSMDINWLQCK